MLQGGACSHALYFFFSCVILGMPIPHWAVVLRRLSPPCFNLSHCPVMLHRLLNEATTCTSSLHRSLLAHCIGSQMGEFSDGR